MAAAVATGCIAGRPTPILARPRSATATPVRRRAARVTLVLQGPSPPVPLRTRPYPPHHSLPLPPSSVSSSRVGRAILIAADRDGPRCRSALRSGRSTQIERPPPLASPNRLPLPCPHPAPWAYVVPAGKATTAARKTPLATLINPATRGLARSSYRRPVRAERQAKPLHRGVSVGFVFGFWQNH